MLLAAPRHLLSWAEKLVIVHSERFGASFSSSFYLFAHLPSSKMPPDAYFFERLEARELRGTALISDQNPRHPPFLVSCGL